MAHSRQGPLKSNLRFAYGSRNSVFAKSHPICPPSLTQPALYVEARARKCAMQTVKWDQARCWYCTSMHITQWWFGMLWSKDMVTSQASWLPAKKALESTVCTKNPTMALGVTAKIPLGKTGASFVLGQCFASTASCSLPEPLRKSTVKTTAEKLESQVRIALR